MIANEQFFDLAAWGYDFITRQDIWRTQIGGALGYCGEAEQPLRILDLGCGPGLSAFVLAEHFSNSQVIGVDVAPKMIARARQHHRRRQGHIKNLRFAQADVYDLPFAPRSFDLILAHSFFYLMPDRPQAVAAAFEVLDAAGQLIALEPHARGSLRRAALGAPLQNAVEEPISNARFAASMILWRLVSGARGRMSRRELTDLFSTAGFANIQTHPTLQGLGIYGIGQRPAGVSESLTA